MTAADIRFYFAILVRELPVALYIVCVVTGVGAFVAFALPPVYKSTATIVVEAPDLPSELARSTVPQNAIAQVQLFREQLLTDAALAKLAEDLKLSPQGTLSDALIQEIRNNTDLEQISFGSGNQIVDAFTISYSAGDPAVAALVANKFSSLILANDLERRQQRAAATLNFFRQDVASLDTALKASESELLAFRNKNIGALPESLGFRRDQIAASKLTLFALAAEEATARLRRASVITNMRTKGQVDTGPTSTEASTLIELKSALGAQLAIFTPDSPSVVGLKARIDALEKALPDFNGPNTDPSDLPAEIKEIDTRLAEIDVERTSLSKTLESLEASLLATPANETSLRTMELERDNIQAQYTAAVARLAEASTGERVEALLKGERLELFQEALPPEYPRSPQRKFIVLGSALAGMILAAGLMLARELLNSRIRRPAELERKLSIKPLGVIPHFQFEKTKSPPRKKLATSPQFKSTSVPISGGQQSWTA